MKTSTSLIAAAALSLAASCPVAAQGIIIVENFNNVGTLPGWVQTNNSVQAGQPWFQGNPGVFAAQAGAPDAYIAANYLSALNGVGTVDNWLITPVLTLAGPTELSFYTRSTGTAGFSDTMEVRFSSGSGTATSGFSTLLATIGGAQVYPSSWQHFTSSLTASGSGRFAFRYTGNAEAANYIGLDTVSVSAVPEPAAWLLLGFGLAALALLRGMRRRGVLAMLLAGAAIALPAAAQEGMIVVRDAQTGQLRAATAAEIKALHEQTKALHPVKPAQDMAVRRDDGTLRKRLGESGMVFEVMTRDADGKLVTQCVSGERAAEDAVRHVSPAAHRNEEPHHD